MFRVIAALLSLMLASAAAAQDSSTLTGTVTYLDRMALPADALLVVEVIAPDGSLAAEARLPTEGRQVPIPFAVELAAGLGGSLRAGLMLGSDLIWLGDSVAVDDTSGDLGELVLRRHVQMGFASAFRCGDRLIRVGFAGDALVLDTGPDRLMMQSVPAASGARYEMAGDAETYFWDHGGEALVSIGGTRLADCRLSFPAPETPYRARGNEPFWSVTQADGALILSWLGFTDLTLPIVDSTLDEAGALVVTAFDRVQAQRAILTRAPALCRDSMTGMPHPETVTLTISMPMGGDTLTGCGGAPADLLTGRTWAVEDIAGTGLIDSSRVTMGFGTDGRVAGSGGCNRWFAGYEMTGEGLTIGQAGSTMMACPEALMTQERRFFEVLAQVTGFDIDETGALVLQAAGQPILTLRAATDGSAP